MITHDWLIHNGYHWRQFEDEAPNSYAGEYRKVWSDINGNDCIVHIFKYNEGKDDFNRMSIDINCYTCQMKTTFYKPVSIEQLNAMIKIVCDNYML